MKFEEIKVGDFTEVEIMVSDEMVRTFARVTGDNNPLHLDDEFAKKTIFKKRIAHGMLVASLISKVLGHDFPGAGTIYVSQSVKFRKPVYVGDKVKIHVEVKEKNEQRRRLYLITDVFDKDVQVISGEAEVYLPLE
ncbi:MaoC family dehydratase [Mesoaciditoga sp.]